MNPYTMTGATVVTIALIMYTLFIIQEVKVRKPTNKLLTFLYVGLFCDIFATACMIIGSPNSPFSLHGFIGYTSLLGMLIDSIWIWQVRKKYGADHKFSDGLNLFSKITYGVWVLLAYITGSILVMLKRMG